jgi:dCMP deaminase
MLHAHVAALRSTCARRHTGAVITDEEGIILGVGYNGSPRGTPHCIEKACDRSQHIPGSDCHALHAEWNAIMHCNLLREARVIYCTTSPCFSCMKMLANSPITTIYYDENYHDSEQVAAYWEMVLHRFIDRVETPSIHFG